jgi:4'-phosphopantetheinyl transferase EntD
MSQVHEACASLLRKHFGSEVLCAVVSVDEDPGKLLREEERVVTKAGPARRREFAAGRVCARGLLERLGYPPAPLLSAADRSPLWPSGAIGSITHNGTLCAVAVARAGRWSALALDVEPDEPLEDELWQEICTPRELEYLRGLAPRSRGRAARVLFSAKECVYKSSDPDTRSSLGFQDAQLEFVPGTDLFRVELQRRSAAPSQGAALTGFHFTCRGAILTGLLR